MERKNTPEWFSEVAIDFDSKYNYKKTFKERFVIWTKIIDSYSDPTSRVLDIGCGSGVFAFYAAKKNLEVIGIDGSSEMIRICNQKKLEDNVENISFIESDIDILRDINIQRADMIICSSVLEYMGNIDRSIELLAGLIKNNGVLILSMPNSFSIYRKMEALLFRIFGRPKYYQFVRHVMKLDEIDEKLKANGLVVVESRYYASTPLLSPIFHLLRLSVYSDNLFVVVARHNCV